jgi:hypothetical protein
MLPTVNWLIRFMMHQKGESVDVTRSALEEMRRAVRHTFLEDPIYDLRKLIPDHDMSRLQADGC